MSNQLGKLLPWPEMIRAALVAFVFGIILSAVLALGTSQNLRFMAAIERTGIDLGQRLYVAFADDDPQSEIANDLIFIDIDEDGCSAFANEYDCQFNYLGQEALLERVIDAAVRQKSKAIVLDFLLPDKREAEAIGFDISSLPKPGPATPILAPMATRLTEDGRVFSLDQTHCGQQVCGNVQYLPAFSVVRDGKSRDYPVTVPLRIGQTAGPGQAAGGGNVVIRDVTLPSIAWKAAEILRPDLQKPAEETVPIRYNLVSRAFPSNTANAHEFPAAGYYKLSQFDPEEPIQWDNAEGKVVIIGSSARVGGDVHETPLGPMAGMEVVGNAIGTMMAGVEPEPAEPSKAAYWWIKLEAILSGLLIAMLIEGVLVVIGWRRELATANGLKTVSSGRFVDRYSFAFLIALVVFFVLETWLVIDSVGDQYADPALSNYEIDVLWPIVAVMLSALIGFAQKITGKVEWLVDRIYAIAARLAGLAGTN